MGAKDRLGAGARFAFDSLRPPTQCATGMNVCSSIESNDSLSHIQNTTTGGAYYELRNCTMIQVLKILVTALEAVGEVFGRRKPKTPEEMARQPIQRRNERAMMFFVVFTLVLCVVLLVIMALR